jgi:hypothetical protein
MLAYVCGNCGAELPTTNGDPLNDQMDRLTAERDHYKAALTEIHNPLSVEGIISIQRALEVIGKMRAIARDALELY